MSAFVQVSKWFRAITQDPALWKAQRENVPFVHSILPPGTFPSQSTDSSERTIVRLTRLAQSWMTPSLRVLSHIEIPFLGEPKKYPNDTLIAGRWLLVCQLDRRFVLYDTDADAETRLPQIIWEQEEQIADWNQLVRTFKEGQWSVSVLFCEPYLQRWYVQLACHVSVRSHSLSSNPS